MGLDVYIQSGFFVCFFFFLSFNSSAEERRLGRKDGERAKLIHNHHFTKHHTDSTTGDMAVSCSCVAQQMRTANAKDPGLM